MYPWKVTILRIQLKGWEGSSLTHEVGYCYWGFKYWCTVYRPYFVKKNILLNFYRSSIVLSPPPPTLGWRKIRKWPKMINRSLILSQLSYQYSNINPRTSRLSLFPKIQFFSQIRPYLTTLTPLWVKEKWSKMICRGLVASSNLDYYPNVELR